MARVAVVRLIAALPGYSQPGRTADERVHQLYATTSMKVQMLIAHTDDTGAGHVALRGWSAVLADRFGSGNQGDRGDHQPLNEDVQLQVTDGPASQSCEAARLESRKPVVSTGQPPPDRERGQQRSDDPNAHRRRKRLLEVLESRKLPQRARCFVR